MSTNSKYTVLVNSCDAFEDCWHPFFHLFATYWPDCDARIILNTETKKWSHPRLNVQCTSVQSDSARRLTWSECLLNALDQIRTPLVLYFQEDYFLNCAVRSDVVNRAADFMIRNSEVKHVALTKHGSHGPYEPYHVDWLKTISQRAKYRISTQAALWRVDTLRSYLAPEENGWMFEIYGTWRSWRRPDCFLCAAFDLESGGAAIDYPHTGIIKGKWLPDIQPLFESHGLRMDFSERGFHVPRHPALHKWDVLKKLFEHPAYFLNQLCELCAPYR
jgi:hypothetical protein